MSTPDVRTVLKVQGRLCWNPTDLSGTYPFGGTALGLTRNKSLRLRASHHVVRAEEYGGAAVGALYAAQEAVFVAMLAAWDGDALSTIAQDSGAGATTGRRVVRLRHTTDGSRAGELVSGNEGILYFAPDADTYPGILFRAALPMLEEDGTWPMHLGEEFGIPAIFLATPDTSGNVYEIGLRQDLTL